MQFKIDDGEHFINNWWVPRWVFLLVNRLWSKL